MFATILILSLASCIPIHGDCQEIPYNVVDVFQYGAIGDGITDDSQVNPPCRPLTILYLFYFILLLFYLFLGKMTKKEMVNCKIPT